MSDAAPTYLRWAAEACRRPRGVARLTPFSTPTVRTADEHFAPMAEPTLDDQGRGVDE